MSQESNIVDTLEARGFISQMTETGLREQAAKQQLTVYCGFDPTAPSMHIGHLQQVFALGHFQRHGHRVIALVGGGTGLIGDPSGRSQERQLQSEAETLANVERIKRQLSSFLDFEGSNAAIMVNNIDWLGSWRFVDFLRDIGKHFSINAMLAKDSVRMRLEEREQGLSYTEFSYMLCQAADFLVLNEKHGCNVQIGGSDQWGNITAGIDLIRRVKGQPAHGLTFPLLTTASGEKFGKSAGNAVWLEPTMTTPYQVYQFWVNTEDQSVIAYLKRFTFLTLPEIAALEQQLQQHPERREAQRALAYEFVRLAYGQATADSIRKASDILFGKSAAGLAETLQPAVIDLLQKEIPTCRVSSETLEQGFTVVDALVQLGIAPSKGQARRLLGQNSVSLNDQPVAEDRPITRSDLLYNRALLVRSGRRQYGLVVLG